VLEVTLFLLSNWLKVVHKFHMLDLFCAGESGIEPAKTFEIDHLPDFYVPTVSMLQVVLEVGSIYVKAQLLIDLTRISDSVDGDGDNVLL
jgi:L-rhamnose isomerase